MCKIENKALLKKMESVIKVASYLVQQYALRFKTDIDQMKLHKLLYFAQRESYVLNEKALFNATFHAGKYGPVILEVRNAFRRKQLKDQLSDKFIEENKDIFDRIWNYYAPKTSWSLSLLSHGEISWKNAIEKMQHPNGPYYVMDEKDIQKDATRIRTRREELKQSSPTA